MHGPIDIDNAENVGEKKRVGVGSEERKKIERRDINLQAVNGGEQLRWPLSCPFHLFGNIISTNQGRAKGKWSGLIYTCSPLPWNRERQEKTKQQERGIARERVRVACKTEKKTSVENKRCGGELVGGH